MDLDVSYFLPTRSYLFYVPTDHSLSLFPPTFPTARSLCVSVCVCLWGVCFVACAFHRGCRCASAAIVAGILPAPHSYHIIEESKRDKRERNRHTTVSLLSLFKKIPLNIRVPIVKELGKKKTNTQHEHYFVFKCLDLLLVIALFCVLLLLLISLNIDWYC